MKIKPAEIQLKNDVINDFSFSFSELLLKKLRSLKDENKIFKKGEVHAIKQAKKCENSQLTGIAKITISYLLEQLHGIGFDGNVGTPKEIEKFISLAEEFLAIFKKNN